MSPTTEKHLYCIPLWGAFPSGIQKPCFCYSKITPLTPSTARSRPHSRYLTAITLAGFPYYTCRIEGQTILSMLFIPYLAYTHRSPPEKKKGKKKLNMCTCLLTLAARPTANGLTSHSIIPVYMFFSLQEDLNLVTRLLKAVLTAHENF